MEWSHPQLQQKHKTVFKKPFVNSKCLFPDVDSNRLQWVSLSNREGGGKDASWTAQANTLVKLCMNLCGTNNLTLSAWTLEGHSSARKRYRRFKDAIYIYKRNGWKKKKKKKSHKSPLRPEISNVFPSPDVNLPHSLKPHRNSPQGLQREKTRIQ